MHRAVVEIVWGDNSLAGNCKFRRRAEITLITVLVGQIFICGLHYRSKRD